MTTEKKKEEKSDTIAKNTVPAANDREKSKVDQKKAMQPSSVICENKKLLIEVSTDNKKHISPIMYSKTSTTHNKQPLMPKNDAQKTAAVLKQVTQTRKHLSTIDNTLRKWRNIFTCISSSNTYVIHYIDNFVNRESSGPGCR